MNTYFNFINKETKKIDTRLGGRHCFTTKAGLLKSMIDNVPAIEKKTKEIIYEAINHYKITDEIFKIIEDQLQLVLVELPHQLPKANIEFMFVQTTGGLPVGCWLPKIVEVNSNYAVGDYRNIEIYFDDYVNVNSFSFGVTVAEINKKTGVKWFYPEYKNHPQVFEHISNL